MPDAEPRKRHCGRWVTGQRPTEVEWLAMHSMNDNERMTNEKIEGECVGEEVRDMRRLGGSTSTRSVLREEKAISFKPVLDGDAAGFVGVSAFRGMLSETGGRRKVLVTRGTRMCAERRAR